MPLDVSLYGLLAVAAGVSFVMQQAVNAALRNAIGSALWAGFVSYLGGTLCMLLLAVAFREAMPAGDNFAKTPWWSWSGGVFGAIYIAISIVLLPRIGTAAFLAFLIAGQMLASMIFDHFGFLGVPLQRINLTRVIGATLLVLGVVLIRR